VQALHATFVAEALAHWAEVLRDAVAPPPPGRRRRAKWGWPWSPRRPPGL